MNTDHLSRRSPIERRCCRSTAKDGNLKIQW
jgi:hypothetical protein